MIGDTKHDVFLSFCHQDEPAVRKVFEQLTAHGLNVFWSEEHMKERAAGLAFPEELFKTLTDSRHLVLYASHHVAASQWVPTECDHFYSTCHLANPTARRIYVVSPNGIGKDDVPSILRDHQRLKSGGELVAQLVKDNIQRLRRTVDELDGTIHDEKKRVEEAFQHYRWGRFWRPVLKHHDIHIFTCARDTKYDGAMARGRGGRTTIDKWDYQTVLDITRFFATHYPDVKITIEDPVSKLSYADIIKPGTHLRLALMIEKLKNKDCIIIGSTDVSDFAELVIARVHNIEAYTDKRVKRKGFVHIKAQQQSFSCGYWPKQDDEDEGVARIDGPGPRDYKIYKIHTAKSEEKCDTTYGILAVVNNPFVDPELAADPAKRPRIVILSGFTGIATNGIAKLITDELYLDEFYKLDRAYVDSDTAFEALIETRFGYLDRDVNARDARVIDRTRGHAIIYGDLVTI